MIDTLRWDTGELAKRYHRELGIDIGHFVRADEIHLRRDDETGVWMFDGCEPGDGGFYEKLAERDYYYMADKWEFHEAVSLLADQPRETSVLEIGCGSGAFLDIARQAGLCNVRGIELSDAAMRSCIDRGHRVTDRMIEELAGDGERFETIVAFQVLEHVPDPAAFLRAASQALAPGGRLIVTTPNREAFARRYQWNLLDLPPHHMSRWDEAAYQKLASHVGLRLAELRYEPLARYHHKYFVNSLVQQLPPKSVRRRLAKLGAKVGFAFYPWKKSIRGHSMMAILTQIAG